MGRRDRAGRIPGHRVPPWFEDAKLGIFVHWGLFSVPAFAPVLADGETMPDLLQRRPGRLGAELPYAEWYDNALRIPGSPTAVHHAATYGDAPYAAFREPFEAMLETWDPEPWADAMAAAGARYVVLVTKHHDGYCLWPSAVANPHRPGWHAPRDVVGDLAAAVRRRGLHFGVYDSAGLDWTWQDLAIREPLDALACVPRDPAYAAYATAQLHELVDRYRPSVVWNDIGSPPGLDVGAFLRHYLARVPDGTINDRWITPGAVVARPRVRRALNAAVRGVLPRVTLPASAKGHPLGDFATPEYASPPAATNHKWEATRGMGAAFGHNRAEPDEHLIDPDELVRGFADMVAKNGNLLLNVGPDAGGHLVEREAVRLRALGDWLAVNHDAIVATRPWHVAAGTTAEGVPVRFTQAGGVVHAVLLAEPGTPTVTVAELATLGDRPVELLGHGPVDATVTAAGLQVRWPADRHPGDRGVGPAPVLRIGAATAAAPIRT